jgi:predicted ATPase
MQADALLAAGRFGSGRAAATEALAVAERTGERFYEAEILRAKGELLLAVGDRQDADEAFRAAIAVARHQGATTLALRSAIRFAHVGNAADQASRLGVLREIFEELPPNAFLAEKEEATALLAG